MFSLHIYIDVTRAILYNDGNERQVWRYMYV